jgi:fucose permease
MPSTPPSTGSRDERAGVLTAYALFILVGLGAGVSGVVLLAQLADYGVDRSTIGLTFFTASAGFVLAGASTGPLIHRYGSRTALLAGAGLFTAVGLYQGSRPPFAALVAVQLAAGYAGGLLESVPNAYLAALPRATSRLNRLHAFFGVGALVGPVAATWLLRHTGWPTVWLALAGIGALATAAVWFAYPDRAVDPLVAAPVEAAAGEPATDGAGLLATVLRQRPVLLGAGLLALYVGLEIGVGTWGVGYLVAARSASDLVAGYTLSGYWLGLTLGRFVLSPLATRLGLRTVGLMYACLLGVTAASTLVWAVPTTGLAPIGFALLGFFLGPVFPTTMAVVPRLTSARLAPTAIGVLNAGSVVGGSALPWLQGVVGQRVGVWTLLPLATVLAVLQVVVWWRTAARLGPEPVADLRLAAVKA